MEKSKEMRKEVVARLRKDVESFLRRDLKTPEDFVFLSGRLQQAGCGYVSPTTLKRVWGYISDKGEEYVPGNFTLRALCQFLGFRTLEEYCSTSASAIQSMEYEGESLEIESLPVDSLLVVEWEPNRRIQLRSAGEATFEVMENRNSRLKPGDLLKCSSLTQRAPAFFRVERQKCKPFSYIAGAQNGVMFEVQAPASEG